MATYAVYTGRWTDWSKGAVLGDQVTMSANASNVLIAFVAIFLTFVGGITWTTVAYVAHQLLATQRESDGLHYHTQALLRNMVSPLGFAIKMIEVGYAWRKNAPSRSIRRGYFFALLAVSIYTMFVAAGLVLSLVATTGDVLLQSPNCGTVYANTIANMSANEQQAFEVATYAWANQEVQQAYAFAQECYGPVEPDSLGATDVNARAPASNCDFYTKSTLNWTTLYPGVCPFAEVVCPANTSDVIEFDTGYLDTHNDLGINAKKEDRLQFRRITTCAPLNSQGFSSGGFVNDSFYGSVATFNYGYNELIPLSSSWPKTTSSLPDDTNITFVYHQGNYDSPQQPYYLQSISTMIGGGITTSSGFSPVFFPRSELGVGDKPFSLFFLANRAVYQAPVPDPWFNATSITLASVSGFGNITIFYSALPGSILGCLDEAHLCNPNLPAPDNCILANELLYDTNNLSTLSTNLQLSSRQQSLALFLTNYISESTMHSTTSTLGANALAANDYLFEGQADLWSAPLPSNQWQAELQRLQASSLARLQRHAFQTAAGPTNPQLIAYLAPYRPALAFVCSSQKFKDTAYSTFSVVGLSLIFGIGGAIVLASTAWMWVIPKWQERKGGRVWRREQWCADDTAVLMASLYQARGLGVWTREGREKVPVTVGVGEVFGAYTEEFRGGKGDDEGVKDMGASGVGETTQSASGGVSYAKTPADPTYTYGKTIVL